jgi:hypothetical protein
MIVFSDLECPACRTFHQRANRILQQHKKDVSMVFVHFPLPMHRFAVPAAQAAECASTQGRFMSFIDAIFAKQDSIGIKSWGSYAHEAGITDTASIAQCARDPAPVKRVEAGRELALRWELRGTPSVIVNGRRYQSPPTDNEIDRVIKEALQASTTTDGSKSVLGPPTLGGSVGVTRPPTPRAYLRDSNIVARNVMLRLFNGIQLSPEQTEEATAIIRRAWREHFVLKSGAPNQWMEQAQNLNAARDSALKALLKSESGQAMFERNARALAAGTARPPT